MCAYVTYDGHIFTQVGVVMSYVLWAVSYSFPVFIVARIVGGISKGNVSLSAAIVTDITTPAHRSKGMVGIYHLCLFVCVCASLSVLCTCVCVLCLCFVCMYLYQEGNGTNGSFKWYRLILIGIGRSLWGPQKLSFVERLYVQCP